MYRRCARTCLDKSMAIELTCLQSQQCHAHTREQRQTPPAERDARIVWHLFGQASGGDKLFLVQRRAIAPIDRTGFADTPVDTCRDLWCTCTFGWVEVHVVQTELLRVANLPLIAVHQAPGNVSTDIGPILHGVQRGRKVVVVVVHTGIILEAASIADTVLRHNDLGTVVLAMDPHQQIVHALGIDLMGRKGWREAKRKVGYSLGSLN